MDSQFNEAREGSATGYAVLGGASAPQPTLRSTATQDQRHTQLDQVRTEAERAAIRISEVRRRLEQIGERLVGPGPQSSGGSASEAMKQAGFIPCTAAAIERQHIELTRIEDLLSGFEQTV